MAQFELNGTSGNDLLDATTRSDAVVLRGFEGDDTLLGGSGRDRLAGANGYNLLNGGGGNDQFFVTPNEAEFNTILGGDGTDR